MPRFTNGSERMGQECPITEGILATHPMLKRMVELVPANPGNFSSERVQVDNFLIGMQNGQPTGEVCYEATCQKCIGHIVVHHNVTTENIGVELPDQCPLKATGPHLIEVIPPTN